MGLFVPFCLFSHFGFFQMTCLWIFHCLMYKVVSCFFFCCCFFSETYFYFAFTSFLKNCTRKNTRKSACITVCWNSGWNKQVFWDTILLPLMSLFKKIFLAVSSGNSSWNMRLKELVMNGGFVCKTQWVPQNHNLVW